MMDITKQAVVEDGSCDEVDIYGMPGHYQRVKGNHMKNKPCPRC